MFKDPFKAKAISCFHRSGRVVKQQWEFTIIQHNSNYALTFSKLMVYGSIMIYMN